MFHYAKEKVLFYQDNALCHKLMKTIVKLNELRFKLIFHPLYSSDMTPIDYWMFADLKTVFQEKRFGSKEEVIAELEAYFESKDKSFYEKCIKILEER